MVTAGRRFLARRTGIRSDGDWCLSFLLFTGSTSLTSIFHLRSDSEAKLVVKLDERLAAGARQVFHSSSVIRSLQ